MTDDRSTNPIRSLLAAERRVHEMAPIPDLYSKLIVRTLLWFSFFTVVYVAFSALV